MRISRTSRTAILIVLALAIFATILHIMGRIPYCTCGLKLWTWDAWGSESSQNFMDPYSSSHFLHGIIFFALLALVARRLSLTAKLWISIGLEMAWELLENSPLIIDRYRAATASLGYTGDSILNSTADVLFMMLGFWLAWRLKWQWSLAILILTELIMLAIYRDNLTLNVLMLLTPIDAVRDWQMSR